MQRPALAHVCTLLRRSRPRPLQEENEAEEELLDAIATALTVVLKRFGDAAMPYVDGLMPSVGSLLVRAAVTMRSRVQPHRAHRV